MTDDEATRLWENAESIPLAKAPTLVLPVERHTLAGLGVVDIHGGGGTGYKTILVHYQDKQPDEIRVVKE
jgi:hypothetical protein